MPKVYVVPANIIFKRGRPRISRIDAPSRRSTATADVFSLGEVAAILGVPKSRVKNWTIGRPLKIVPTVLAQQGKGSRNLYSLDDVYLFALVNQLHDDGLSTSAIEYAVFATFQGPRLGPVQFFSLTTVNGKLRGKFHTSDFRWENIPKKRSKVAGIATPGTYVLNFRELVAWVNYRVAKLRRRD